MHTIYLDIETFGTKPDEKQFIPRKEDIKAPGNYKKQEAIDAYIEKEYQARLDNMGAEIDKQWRKNALDVFKCKIICLAYKHNHDDTVALCYETEEEIIMALNDFIKGMGAEAHTIRWVTYNGTEFDIPIVALRALKYGAIELYRSLPKDSRDERNVDLMKKITPTIWKSYHKLSVVCNYFNIPVKSNGLDGSKVHDYYLDGRIDEIAQYDIEDVDVLPLLAEKLQLNYITRFIA